MTTNYDKEMARLVGKKGLLPVRLTTTPGCQKVLFPVRIVACTANFGRVYVTVEPIGGSGQQVVEASKIQFSS